MINHEYKFVFVHIPRTAGTSIERIFGYDGFQHYTALEYLGKLGYRDWRSYCTFTFVRNPWDRVVSYYYWRHRRKEPDAADTAFEQWFIRNYRLIKGGKHDILNRYYGRSGDPNGWRVKLDNQLYMITDMTDDVILDYVCRYESLQKDFSFIQKRLGFNGDIPEERRLINRPDYRNAHTLKTKQLAGELYSKDIEYFGYQYD